MMKTVPPPKAVGVFFAVKEKIIINTLEEK